MAITTTTINNNRSRPNNRQAYNNNDSGQARANYDHPQSVSGADMSVRDIDDSEESAYDQVWSVLSRRFGHFENIFKTSECPT